ncbi:glycosyltransferase family 2 protein [Glycomyces buryatensis]|uniref:Glycosyltransferase n=1 Tax=Glycomyces buryatensis TaxID=2570927 RepID=A0A4S8QG93_9ACTN|nr:glycosyltransferase [Glycomyces buryatensis]THV43390.1 glycosyltransferase [Glycomyces buryatensis]
MSVNTPDVTVVTAVYNTLPYLNDCLESLAAQTIGAGRYEVIAVDDGSTDGSGEELDRFAEKYPDTFRVFHQENSGGPAVPSNLALEHARGRYVFFIGSDDYLGRESLERMVAAADGWGADVLLCKMVGVGGRKAPPVFDHTLPDAPFPSEKLAWALSNTKLFRRELVEAEALRFPEDMAVCSDVPFTLRAMTAAQKISVLADYDHYFAVKRDEGENLIYATAPLGWVGAAQRLVEVACELFEPGADRDDLIYRVFSREIAKILQPHLLALDPFDRAAAWNAVADFADEHLTEVLRSRLPTEKRLRLSLAQRRDHERLEAVLAEGAPGFAVEDGRLFVRYPGFREDGADFPDEWFEAQAERVTMRLIRGIHSRYLVWTGVKRDEYALEYSFSLPVTGLDPAAVQVGLERLKAGKNPRPRTVRPAVAEVGPQITAEVELGPDGDDTALVARIPMSALTNRKTGRWTLRAYVVLGAFVYDLPLKAPHDYVQREGRPRGVSVEWGERHSVVVRVGERATRRGPRARLGRLKMRILTKN